MLRWLPYLELARLEDHDDDFDGVADLRRNDVMEYCRGGGNISASANNKSGGGGGGGGGGGSGSGDDDLWVECLVVRAVRPPKPTQPTTYEIRFQRPSDHTAAGGSGKFTVMRVQRHELRPRQVDTLPGVAATREERPMCFELKGGRLWEDSKSRGAPRADSGRGQSGRIRHAVRAAFPPGDPRSTVQSKNLWRALFEHAEPAHVKAALLSRNPDFRPPAAAARGPSTVYARLSREPRLPNWEMFSHDGGDGGELGDVADYFQLIAHVLLCGASFTTPADNGFLAALPRDPARPFYFDTSFRHILTSAESFYCYCWKKFLRQELPLAYLPRWLGSCTKLAAACIHVLALRKARGGDERDADALFTTVFGSAFADTVASIAEYEASAADDAQPLDWDVTEGAGTSDDDDASAGVAPRFVLTCQALRLLEYYLAHFDQPSLLATGGAVLGDRGRGRLCNHFAALKRIWGTSQSVLKSVVGSFASGELGHVAEHAGDAFGDDDEEDMGTEPRAMAHDDLSATPASPATAAGICVAIFRSVLRRTSRAEERHVLSQQAAATAVDAALQNLVAITSRVRSHSRDPQELRRAIREAEAKGVPSSARAVKMARAVLRQLQQQAGSQGEGLGSLFDEVEADGSSDASFCIVGYGSFALLTNRWLMESVLRMTTLCLATVLRGTPHARLFTFTAGGFHGHDADSSRAASVRVFTDAAANGLGLIRSMFDLSLIHI